MWLELEPIYTDASRNCRSSPIPSGNKHGVVLHGLGFSSHVLPVNLGAACLLVVLVPRLGGLGHQNFSRLQRSAKGVVCWTGWVSLALMSLTCPQAHGDETARGST